MQPRSRENHDKNRHTIRSSQYWVCKIYEWYPLRALVFVDLSSRQSLVEAAIILNYFM